MVRRVSYVKVVAVCDVQKEVASTGAPLAHDPLGQTQVLNDEMLHHGK